ncbi:MAG: peptidylprolyl isomerase [Wolinella sp.]
MINWMQKHRKYLVVTIWISTIAFVGAGFVGWGAYSFSSSSSWVAKVGDTKITQTDLEQEYSRLYDFYNKIVGGSLDKEQAKSLGIEKQALESLISKTLMLNFAVDSGLRVSDDDVARAVVNMDAFHVDGNFSEEAYRKVLQDNNYKPVAFERALHDSLLLEKLSVVLTPNVTELERESLGAAFYIKDKISMKVLDSSNITPSVTDGEIEAFWTENKNSYMTDRVYDIVYALTKSNDINVTDEELQIHYDSFKNNYVGLDGRPLEFELARTRVERDYKDAQAEKSALRLYIEFKKDATPHGISYSLAESDKKLGDELLLRLAEIKAGETLKPVPSPDGYLTVKLLGIKESEPMSFESAKELAKSDLLAHKKGKILEERAKEGLKSFSGEVVGFFGRDDVAKIMLLDTEEAAEFLAQLFQSTETKGYVMLDDKAVLYEILEQKLPKSEEMIKNLDFVTKNITQIKERLAESAFLDYLSKRYLIVRKQ